MGIRGLVAGFAVAATLVAGCDDAEDSRSYGDGDAGPADVVNGYFSALHRGDGESACGLLSEDAQRIAVKVFEGEGDPDFPDAESLDPSECADAVAGASLSGISVPTVKPTEVKVSSDGSTAEVTFPDCNGLALSKTDEGWWRLETPIPSGR